MFRLISDILVSDILVSDIFPMLVLNVRQEYNINTGKISLTKCNISA